jgi:plastocyanin
MRRRFIAVAALAGCLLLLSTPAAFAGGGGSHCAGFGEGAEVVLRDVCLEGTAQFVPAGRDLRVVNDGQMQHDLVAVGGAFAVDLLDPGESSAIASPDPGIYRVYCTLHGTAQGGGMAGVLIVGDPAGAAAPTADLVQTATVPVADTASVAHPATWWAVGAAVLAVMLALASLTLTIRRRPAVEKPTAEV